MKLLVMTFLLFSSAFASEQEFASLVSKHEGLCDSKNQSCRLVIIPEPGTVRSGKCSGKFMDMIPCNLYYAADLEGTAMLLKCAIDPDQPLIDQVMPAEAMTYQVAAVMTEEFGREVVKEDSNSYFYIGNTAVEAHISEGVEGRRSTVSMMTKFGPSELTSVSCD